MPLTLRVNGRERSVDVMPDVSLLEVLRDSLDLTGAKYGCGEARCGACVVLVGDRPVPACVTPVADTIGAEITTVEGLADGDRLHPVQQAFVDEGALQCGYCTPGMIMAAVALLRETPRPSEAEIVSWMEPHLCRCGAYPRIVRAIQRAAGAFTNLAATAGTSATTTTFATPVATTSGEASTPSASGASGASGAWTRE